MAFLWLKILNERGQKRMGTVINANRKTTNGKITAQYHSGVQKGVSECTNLRGSAD